MKRNEKRDRKKRKGQRNRDTPLIFNELLINNAFYVRGPQPIGPVRASKLYIVETSIRREDIRYDTRLPPHVYILSLIQYARRAMIMIPRTYRYVLGTAQEAATLYSVGQRKPIVL